ncbi:MAG: hydroxymethylpyrimidine/phosphomethylpyrimidine kinase [Mariprofundales bacterium]
MKRCLTIGGSDCSGGAGVEADLAIFRDAHLSGCSAITALTAQTAAAIYRIEPTPLPQIAATFAALAESASIHAIKTGMLVDQPRVACIAEAIAQHFPHAPLVVDPVLISSSGRRLLSEDGVTALCNHLLPQATVITPNLDEAAVLLNAPVADRKAAALTLAERFGCAVLLKGGHGTGATVTDTLATADGALRQWHSPRQTLTTERAHGTGCRTASAITVAFARNIPLQEAIPLAHQAAIDGCWSRH